MRSTKSFFDGWGRAELSLTCLSARSLPGRLQWPKTQISQMLLVGQKVAIKVLRDRKDGSLILGLERACRCDLQSVMIMGENQSSFCSSQEMAMIKAVFSA